LNEIVLHDYWRSSAAYRVRIALGLKGLSWTRRTVDLAGGAQQSAQYKAVNPLGLVPVLEIGGLRLTQSLSIIDYLDARFPDPPLIPSNPAVRAAALSRALTIAADVHPINNLSVTQYLRDELGAGQEQVRRWMHHWMHRGFGALERDAPQAGLFGGTSPDIADICLVPQIYNARRWEVELVDYPQLLRIDADLRNNPAFAAAAPEAVKAAEQG
jgi:maleylacetoacetate isomerase